MPLPECRDIGQRRAPFTCIQPCLRNSRPPHDTRPTDELAYLVEEAPADGRGTHHTGRADHGARRHRRGAPQAAARSVAFHTAAICQEGAPFETEGFVPPPGGRAHEVGASETNRKS